MVELDPIALHAQVIGSMIDFVAVEPAQTIARMADPAVRIVSLTITEGGYYVGAKTDVFDATHPDMVHDAAHPDAPCTVFGIILAALQSRRAAGIAPFTVMSCDNLPENGHVAAAAVIGLAGLIDPVLADWVRANVAFPCGMVDCITPATSDRENRAVVPLLRRDRRRRQSDRAQRRQRRRPQIARSGGKGRSGRVHRQRRGFR